jgi:hypothetical protein
MAMSGDARTLIMGDPACDAAGQPGAGRLYAYTRSGTTWARSQLIESPDPLSGTGFGTTTAMAADGATATVAIYGPPAEQRTPYAWVYELAGGQWRRRTLLATGRSDPELSFSCDAIVRGGRRIVCAAFEDVGFNTAQGVLYLFDRPAAGWRAGAQPQRLFVPSGFALDRLGSAGAWGWPRVAARADGTLIDATIAAYNLASGAYPNDRMGYEFRR